MVVSILKQQLYSGSSLTNDLFDIYGSRGVMMIETTGHTDAGLDLDAAQDEIIASAPSVFPGTALPQNRILKTEHINDTDCRSWLEYKLYPFQNTDPDLYARFRTGHVGLQWFRTSDKEAENSDQDSVGGDGFDSVGRPEDDFNTTPNWNYSFYENRNHPPEPYTLSLPSIQVIVWGNVSTNPLASVAPFLDTMNSLAITFGNYSFPAKTLRFDGADIDWLKQGSSDTFSFQYQFTHIRTQFEKQIAYWDSAVGYWRTKIVPMYEQKAYAGAFPV